jgi:hypothetical protein
MKDSILNSALIYPFRLLMFFGKMHFVLQNDYFQEVCLGCLEH